MFFLKSINYIFPHEHFIPDSVEKDLRHNFHVGEKYNYSVMST